MERRFVIQEHQARAFHHDFRLEKDGVLKNWAVPKGVPEAPGVKRLAIQVEYHDLAYGDFEGTIPAGNYGAGTVRIWDHGNYDLHEWRRGKITLALHGRRLEGDWCLVRFPRAGRQAWLLFSQSP